jgi:hypothetical protein
MEEPSDTEAVQPNSIIGNLRQRRVQILEALYEDVKVAHWDEGGHPPIYVRYRPVEHEQISRVLRRIETAKPKDQPRVELEGNMDLLIRGCIGVFAVVDGEKVSLRPGDPRGGWTNFDPDLALALGLAEDAVEAKNITARRVVKGLFLTDGDIMSHATHLIAFSDYKQVEADEELRGESDSAGAEN